VIDSRAIKNMADYIYTMESRLSPEQMRTVNTVQELSRAHGLNVYLTGGAIRDILTGFPIRDLDFTVQGNPLKLQHDIEKSGGIVDVVDQTFFVIHAIFHGIRAEISMARAEVFDKPGKPPLVTPATINEDLRRRDFTFNAMALSLNEGSRGLLLDPFNGAADIEARLIRVLHSYAFLEDPSRLIRASRFVTRFGWELEERTRARYNSAIEGEYIQFMGNRAIGYEAEQIAYEENPIAVMSALEAEGWLKVLCPKWTVAKADIPELAQLLKTRATMAEFNIAVDAAPAVMHFLTLKLGDADIAAIQKLIPHREFVAAWKRLENDAKELSKKLLSKEAALNSGAWKILSSAKPEALLYLDVTGRNKTVDEKIKDFFGKWRQVQEKIPVAQMAELRITPQLPEYSQICQEAFLLLLDGKLRNEAEIAKFLAPFEPPPPPPPPVPVRRGRAAAKKVPTPAAKPQSLEVVVAAAEEISQPAAVEAPVVAPKPAAARKPAEKIQVTAAHIAKSAPEVKKTPVPAKPVAPKKTVKVQGAKKAAPKAAKPAAKSASKVAGKTASKKTSKTAKPPKPVAGKAKPAAKKAAGKKPVHKAAEKNHGKKGDKRDKKHSKRR
jgi:tRNA nucleotidyltransferase/poly(A) polymerase